MRPRHVIGRDGTPRVTRAGSTTVRRLLLAAVGCWLIGELSLLGLGGPDGWPIMAGWAGAAAVVAVAARLLTPVGRALGATVLVPLCVLLIFEGGVVFLPSAVVLTAAALAALPRRRGHVG